MIFRAAAMNQRRSLYKRWVAGRATGGSALLAGAPGRFSDDGWCLRRGGGGARHRGQGLGARGGCKGSAATEGCAGGCLLR